jgi:putative NIF3 family GTP cyclohydrolase 1 type 2
MNNTSSEEALSRRKFVFGSLSALGMTSFLLNGSGAAASNSSASPQAHTVQHIIDIILKEIPGAPFEKTVDTLKAGRAGTIVTGIVTTMFATVEVIRKTIDLKANFIIAHEPTFYNHLDETTWLRQDKVFTFKQKLLDDHQIAVWRFHDYWHSHQPDGVRMGVLTDLGWKEYSDSNNPRMLVLPATTLKNIIRHVKTRLGIKNVRIVGDPAQLCKRILLMPGASGGRSQIQQLMVEEPDLIICGEVAEWETSEYIRDAIAMGAQRSLIVLGHAQSEEPGMEWLVQWLQPKVSGMKVTHIASQNPFTWI